MYELSSPAYTPIVFYGAALIKNSGNVLKGRGWNT
jgi:hypothetical protein